MDAAAIRAELDSQATAMGQRIKLLREQAGMSQSQLAERIGAGTYDVVGRLEQGIAKGVTLAHLWGLIRWGWSMRRSADWLLGGCSVLDMLDLETLKEELLRRWLAKDYARIMDSMRAGGAGRKADGSGP